MSTGASLENRATPFEPGTELGRDLLVVEHMRRGRDLDVYHSWSIGRGSSVVVKMVRPDRANSRRVRSRLKREATLLGQLTHPHIVRFYETLSTPLPGMVLETVDGNTLAALIDDRELDATELGFLGLHLASAIRYLHRNGVLHLDLKPSNVIESNGRAILLDLSIARPPGPARSGVGTWGYMAPEQVVGGVLGPPADVWGLGVTLYEAATGIPAFDDPRGIDSKSHPPRSSTCGPYSHDLDLDDRLALVRTPWPPEHLRSIPPMLVGLIEQCLSPQLNLRPPVEEVMAQLEQVAGVVTSERRFG